MKVGSKAPGFRLQDETGAWVSLDDLNGKRVVLFFYPKASTPGCTVEACEFRDTMPRFAADGVVVLGISPDPVRKQARFKAAQGLTYPLLADVDTTTCQAYGVWQQKLFWGRHYMGVIRSTFVIDADGRLEQEWRDVPHEGHAAYVSAWLRGEPLPALPAAKGAKAKKSTPGTSPAKTPSAKRSPAKKSPAKQVLAKAAAKKR